MRPYPARQFSFSKIIALFVFAVALVTSTYAQQITVGRNVQITADHPKVIHQEVFSSVNPDNPQQMLACSIYEPGGRDFNAVYASWDAGKTWQQTMNTDNTELGGDPVCAFGPDGSAYLVVLYVPKGGKLEGEHDDYAMWVYRSTDAGRTWQEPTRLPFIDREYITWDRTGGKYNGRMYINGTGSVHPISDDEGERLIGLKLYTSDDHGKIFSNAPLRFAAPPHSILGMANSVVLSDGTLVTLFGETLEGFSQEMNLTQAELKPSAQIDIVRSEDGGRSLSAATKIDDWYMHRPRSEGALIPMLAVDPGSSVFKDRLYAVWCNFRVGHLQVMFSFSADKGKTWSKSRIISDEGYSGEGDKGPDAITPVIAVNKQGVVGIAWGDRRDNSDNLGWWYRFTASLDGGETFLPSTKVSEAANTYNGPRDWTPGAGAQKAGSDGVASLDLSVSPGLFLYNAGHTGGMDVSSDGTFYPVWVDDRTGVPQMWIAPVNVAGQVFKHGSAELAALDDISDKVAFDVDKTEFDAAKNLVTVTLRLKNTSKENIIGPVKGRVCWINSGVGRVSIVNADNKQAGSGAIWDFTPLLKGGKLKPDEKSEARQLVFQLSGVRSIRPDRVFESDLSNASVVILGKAEAAKSEKTD
jgi:hypothetical protein